MSTFQFKQFSIKQTDSAMKVGTDGVLLGASTPISGTEKQILDIGSGTGLLSLMLAQRCPSAQITSIEIDEAAAKESAHNFKESPFSSRINSIQSDLNSFTDATEKNQFDLIICNPPFFPGSQAEGSRKLARDSNQLTADELLEGAIQLLTTAGQLSIVIPYLNEESFLMKAERKGLIPIEILRVRGRKDSKLIRSIIHFKKVKKELIEKDMHIEITERHEYSEEHKDLMKDFLTIF